MIQKTKVMKRVLLFSLLAMVPAMALATGQAADIIYINGHKWWLMGRPVGADSALYVNVRERLPKYVQESTANWDNFEGYWSLDGEWLVLDSIVCVVYEDSTYKKSYETSLSQATMREVFGNYYRDGRIVATWLTGTIRLAQGKRIFYEHMGWNRHYETEMMLEVNEGHIVGRTLYHNRIVVDGFFFDEDASPEKWYEFRKGFLPIIEKYHVFDTLSSLYMSVSREVVDSLGNMTDVEVKVLYSNYMNNPMPELTDALVREFKQYLMSIRPWRVWYCNGEYISLWQGWMIPFRKRDFQ